jgi:hypothetical protein
MPLEHLPAIDAQPLPPDQAPTSAAATWTAAGAGGCGRRAS